MTKIFIADLNDGATQADNLSIDDSAFWDLLGCVSMKDHFPKTTLAIRSNAPPTDYLEVGSMSVVSGRLKQVMEKFEPQAEFFKLHIQTGREDFKSIEYYCCNILDCVDAVDYDRSQLTFHTKPGFTDRIDAIDKLVINEAVAASHVLFRLDKGAKYIICVNDRLADAITQGAFSGCTCIAPEEWRFGL